MRTGAHFLEFVKAEAEEEEEEEDGEGLEEEGLFLVCLKVEGSTPFHFQYFTALCAIRSRHNITCGMSRPDVRSAASNKSLAGTPAKESHDI